MEIYKNILRRTVSIITILMLVITSAYAGGSVTTAAAWTGSIATSFAGGTGTSTSPYLISTPEQLAYLASLVNANNISYNTKYYELTGDIDLGGKEWTPIGKGVLATDLTANSNYAFKGVFNGKGYTVSNFKITKASTSYLGLFGNIYGGNSASVTNLHVADFTISATLSGSYNLAAGGLAGTCYGVISSCGSSNGTINIKTTAASNATCYGGGLVGRNQGGAITKSYSRADVSTATSGTSCHSYAGGLVGHITTGNVTYCYATGNVNSSSDGTTSAAYAGGFTASNGGTITSSYANGTAYSLSKSSTAMAAGFVALNSSAIATSYATGDVTTVSSTKTGYGGGFVANSASTSSTTATLTSCFATGNVNVTGVNNAYAGGFAGLSGGTVTKCYRTTSQSVSGTTTGTAGTQTAASNLMKKAFFTSTTYFTTIWDFTDEWTIGVSGKYEYPTLISVPHPVSWSGDMATSFSGGNGSAAAPYEIATAGELALLADNVNSGNTYQGEYFKLAANIDLGGLEWIPIGRGRLTAGEPNASNAFCGTFDGGNYIVSNFTITTANTAYTGLFGIVYGGNITNLKVTDFIIDVTTPTGCLATVGGIAGTNTGVISGCYASGSVTGSGSQTAAYVGGLVGRNESGLVSGSIAEVTVASNTTADSCHAFAGGLVGYNNIGTITTSYSTGETNAHSSGTTSAAYAGGITAMSMPNSVIMDSYSNSNVSSISDKSTAITGGFVGHNLGDVSNCYSTGNVNCNSLTKSGYGGGFVGNTSGTVKSCFTVSNVTLSASANKNVGNFAGSSSATLTNCYYSNSQTVSPTPSQSYGTATSASNLTKQAFYTSTSNFASPWNMTTIWTIGKVSGYNYPTFINTIADAEPELPKDDDPNIDPEGWDGTAAKEFAGGKGTESAPYEIATPGQLLLLANEVNDGNSDYTDKYYILTDNIDLNHRAWTSIGKGSQSGATVSNNDAFYGSFDGNGYTIENMKINRAPNGFAGLFGSVYGGELKNIILNNVTVDIAYSTSTQALRVGAVAGYTNSTISDCYAGGEMTITSSGTFSHIYAGGIAGYAAGNGEISGCNTEIAIDAVSSTYTSYSGGIIGYVEDSTILKCSSAGNITAKADMQAYAGGIVGYIDADNNVLNCYSRGNITAESSGDNSYVGGLAGYNAGAAWATSYASGNVTGTSVSYDSCAGGLFGASSGAITSCFATGDVFADAPAGDGLIGGLIGRYVSGMLNNCYRSSSQDVDGTDDTNISINARGQAKDIAELNSQDFLTSTSYFVLPWDFETVWQYRTATGYEFPVHRDTVSAGAASLDVWEGQVAEGFESGSGTRARPYKIANAAQLAYLAYMVNTGTDYSGSYFELTADIDLSESTWVPIGKGVNMTSAALKTDKAFNGIFEGNGYSVSNMSITATSKGCYGLFGCIYNGSVSNLNVDNYEINITSPNATYIFAGGVAGVNYGGVISSVRAVGSITASTSGSDGVYCGGITGISNEGIIEVSYSASSVNATNTGTGICISGGIAGLSSASEVNDCYNIGKVKSSGKGAAYAGGIAGMAESDSIICVGYSTGDISSASTVADSYAGGIVGMADSSEIESALSIGDITAIYGGGVVGKNSSSAITKCYKNNQQTVTADTVNTNGTALAATKFTEQSFLTDTRYFTTLWDFDSIWAIGEAADYEYPTLQSVAHITAGESDNPIENESEFDIIYEDGALTITAETSVNNALIILAAYNGNKMTSTEILTENISQGGNLFFTNTFTEAGADKIKIMIWDSADNQSQLTKATEIEL